MVRFAVGLIDVQSGHLPLQGTRNRRIHAVFESLSVEVLHCAHELCLFKCTVADHHALFECDSFFF